MNPSYSKTIKTNESMVFLKLLEKYFPTRHITHKIFNKNTVKISYNWMKNIHNKNVLNPRTMSFVYNWRNKESCPLSEDWLTPQLMHRATVTNDVNEDTKRYIGHADTFVKKRQSNYKRDFKYQEYRYSTR